MAITFERLDFEILKARPRARAMQGLMPTSAAVSTRSQESRADKDVPDERSPGGSVIMAAVEDDPILAWASARAVQADGEECWHLDGIGVNPGRDHLVKPLLTALAEAISEKLMAISDANAFRLGCLLTSTGFKLRTYIWKLWSEDIAPPRRTPGAGAADQRAVTLEPVSRDNWEQCLNLTLAPAQYFMCSDASFILLEAAYRPDRTGYALRLDGSVVGMVLIHKQGGQEWFIERLFVDRRLQNTRIGLRAIQALHSLAKHNRVNILSASYLVDNAAAHAVYASAGFRRAGTLQNGETVVVNDL